MSNILLSQIPLEQLKVELLERFRSELQLLNQEKSQKSSLEQLLTRKQAAAILGVSLPTLDDWTKKGEIVCYRTPSGSGKRYKSAEVQNALVKIKTFKKSL